MLISHHRSDSDPALRAQENAVICDVTEKLVSDFHGRLSRYLVRSYVLEAFSQISHRSSWEELTDTLRLVTTFRLAAVDDSLWGVTENPSSPVNGPVLEGV